MVEVSTSILSVKKGEESATFFELEASKTDYFHIDVMDGNFVEKNTYEYMVKIRISLLFLFLALHLNQPCNYSLLFFLLIA